MKRVAVWSLIMLTFFLSSCVTKSTEISNNMMARIYKAYFNEYVLPNNPDAKLEDHLECYQFLKRFKIKGEKLQVYLFAWEVDEDIKEWELIINDKSYYFEHKVNFVVFNNNDKNFYMITEAINSNLFSVTDFEEALLRLDIYKKSG